MSHRSSVMLVLLVIAITTVSRNGESQPLTVDTAINLGPDVNSPQDDYCPMLTETGDTLIFTTARQIQGKLWKTLNSELVWVSCPHVIHCEPRTWRPMHLLDTVQLNGVRMNLNEGAFIISHDKSFAIFSSGRVLSVGGQSAYHDLYQITVDAHGKPSGAPKELVSVNDPDEWDSEPALSSDDSILFFSSARKHGQNRSRDLDLYYSTRLRDGSWSEARTVGLAINTIGSEVSPFVTKGDTLYFASDGNPDMHRPGEGQGNRDIFRAHFFRGRDGLTFEKPERLGPPYNSPYNDEFPFISANGEMFLFASDRPGGEGKLDLYSVCRYIPPAPPTITLRGTVTERPEDDKDDRNKQPLPTTVRIQDATMGEMKSVVTDASGHFSAKLLPDHRYIIYPDSLPCFRSPAKYSASSPLPFADTVLTADFIYRSIRERIGLRTDTVVPFFVTGYWYPNSPQNYAALLSRKDVMEQNQVKYIWPVWDMPVEHDKKTGDSIDYRTMSTAVGMLLDQSIYKPVEEMLQKMYETACNDSALELRLSVTGFTDERSLMDGPYTDEPVTIDHVNIDSGALMNHDGYPASPGNRYLSKLRAYFTLETIDRDLMERSAEYRRMKGEHRVVFAAHGEDVDVSGNALAFKRRVDIQVALIHPAIARQLRAEYPFVNQKLGTAR